MIDNSPRFVVRPYRPEEAPQLRRLYARVGNPYRLEDQAELAGMRTRALRAQQTGERWIADDTP